MVVLKCGRRLPQVSEVVTHVGKTEATGQMVAIAHRVTGDEEDSSIPWKYVPPMGEQQIDSESSSSEDSSGSVVPSQGPAQIQWMVLLAPAQYLFSLFLLKEPQLPLEKPFYMTQVRLNLLEV